MTFATRRIKSLTGAEVGFAGPVGLEARMIIDQAVTVMADAVSGNAVLQGARDMLLPNNFIEGGRTPFAV